MSTLRFPPNKEQMNRLSTRRSHAAPLPSLGDVHSKLHRIVFRHEQVKVAFHQLDSQIRAGLLEAEDVFASLAIQLMNLVGLKTVEMAAERRFSSIVTSIDRSHLQDENYLNKAEAAGNELIERQKMQLIQLINLLRKIEAQVNSSQKSIHQNLANHQDFIKKFFQKACSHIASVHEFGQSNDQLILMMLKILKATFNHVGAALESVGAGIDDLICDLADKICNPMVEYVKGLKVEMKKGACLSLLEVVREMHGSMQVRALELEEARKQSRVAEESRVEALSRLMKSEEMARELMTSLGMLTQDTTGPEENLTQKKSLSSKEDPAKDDNLLWELLRNKRKSISDSPLGPNELLGIGKCNKKLCSKTMIPTLAHRPTMGSQSKRSHLQSSLNYSRLLLGSSPSATTRKVLRGKHVTP